MDNFELFYKHFNEFLKALDQKSSDIKEQILYVLFTSNSHLSAQEICTKIYENYKNEVSMTSIYSFLNFLESHHLANSFEENGIKKFELNLQREKFQRAVTYDDTLWDLRRLSSKK